MPERFLDTEWQRASRAEDIERLNRQHAGLFDRFAVLPTIAQQEVLNKIPQLKAEANTRELLLGKMRSLVEAEHRRIFGEEKKTGDTEKKAASPQEQATTDALLEKFTAYLDVEDRAKEDLRQHTIESIKERTYKIGSSRRKRGGQAYKDVKRDSIRRDTPASS